jgi:putative transposase
MAVPLRNAAPEDVASSSRTFFVTTKTAMGRALLQSNRNATLLIDVLRSCVAARRFRVKDFVVMPNQVHLLITLGADVTIEKAMQFIKGGFSFRLRKETGYAGEVWQRGFSDVRVRDAESFRRFRIYIAQNPVEARLVPSADLFPWSFESQRRLKAAGAKVPSSLGDEPPDGKPCPDTNPGVGHPGDSD